MQTFNFLKIIPKVIEIFTAINTTPKNKGKSFILHKIKTQLQRCSHFYFTEVQITWIFDICFLLVVATRYRCIVRFAIVSSIDDGRRMQISDTSANVVVHMYYAIYRMISPLSHTLHTPVWVPSTNSKDEMWNSKTNTIASSSQPFWHMQCMKSWAVGRRTCVNPQASVSTIQWGGHNHWSITSNSLNDLQR